METPDQRNANQAAVDADNSQHVFDFIRGIFAPSDAQDIILSLIQDKIQYHQRRNFSAMETLGKQDEHSTRRIDELKKIREEVYELIRDADTKGVRLHIDSQIRISVC